MEGIDVVDAIGLSGDASDISSATTDKACVRDKGDSSGRLRKLGWSWEKMEKMEDTWFLD